MLGVEESITQLHERVTQQEARLSALKGVHLGLNFFPALGRCLRVFSDPSPNCRPFLELGGKVDFLERELETTKVMAGRSVEALAWSLEERRAMEGELN